jgi:hypothetical protein
MPRGLDSADRKLLIGAGILFTILVVLAAMVAHPQNSGIAAAPSTYSASWDGAEGAFLLLQQLGYNVSRWEQSPAALPQDSNNKVLILADPTEPPSEEERYDIIEFLEKGGKVIATGAAASEFLPNASQFAEGNPIDTKEAFDALLPSPIVRGAAQITMAPPEDWAPASVRQVVVYGDDSTAAVITYQFGKGQVIWWAAPTPLTNGALLDSGNLAFFLNCVGPPGQAAIFWDEYFHGVRGSLVDFFMHTPVVWAAVQFALVFLAILATYSRRLGPIRAPATQSRLSPLEFVDTLGDLYLSAHVSAAAVGIAYQRLRFTLTRKLGLPMDISSKELASAASTSLGWEEAPLLNVLVRCDSAKEAPKGRIEKPLALFQEIHDYAAMLEVKRPITKERKRNEQGE